MCVSRAQLAQETRDGHHRPPGDCVHPHRPGCAQSRDIHSQPLSLRVPLLHEPEGADSIVLGTFQPVPRAVAPAQGPRRGSLPGGAASPR